ncbi:MAG: hypothetical protein JJ913_13510 [Rhizobiaceae bacterium]|nr:hypothetical protein [Rhizobiaceae bacterium]
MANIRLLAASVIAASVLSSSMAAADDYLGSYVARLSEDDHYASDGYPLDTAAQVVRQDRANVHRFGVIDRDDDADPWFAQAAARTELERLLNQPGAMNAATREIVFQGTPLVKVDVYRNSVRVTVLDGGGSGSAGGFSGSN